MSDGPNGFGSAAAAYGDIDVGHHTATPPARSRRRHGAARPGRTGVCALDPHRAAGRRLAPFNHFGIELPERADVDDVAARGEVEGCLSYPATMMPPPIGYICMLTDPDGNMVEFSWDQGVYEAARSDWA